MSRITGLLHLLIPAFALNLTLSSASYGSTALDACLLKAISNARDDTSVGKLRQGCANSSNVTIKEQPIKKIDTPVYELSAVDERFNAEMEFEERPFVITPHKPNYILFTAFNNPNQAPFEEATGIQDPLEDTEVTFQVSIKAPLWRDILGSNIDGYVAYTARSWWQLFNDDISAPFRETNYEPELFVRRADKIKVLGITMSGWALGFNHQSNGRSEPLSRSWNRIMGRTGVELNNDLTMMLRAWYRLPEDEDEDDNPGIYKYMGYGDIRTIWTPNRNTFTAMLRPGTEKTGYELTWSYPISKVFRVYTQYYKGYGESLVDYDYNNERFGIGISMNDYLMRN
jgi:phospholipase A1